MVSTDCMTARKCSFPRSDRRMMLREDRIDFPEDRTDRLESIIIAGTKTETEMSSEDILRTLLDMQQVLPLISRTLAPAVD